MNKHPKIGDIMLVECNGMLAFSGFIRFVPNDLSRDECIFGRDLDTLYRADINTPIPYCERNDLWVVHSSNIKTFNIE